MVKALAFDLDGTLVDSFAGIHDALMHTRRHLGLPEHSLAETTAMVGHGLESLLAKAFGAALVPEALTVYRARYAEIVEDTCEPLPGADALIAEAKRRGLPIALCSNKPSYFSERILARRGWVFDVVLGPDKVAHPKPHPAMLLAAQRLLGATPLYVGDMTVDFEAARAADVPVALVATGSMTMAALSATGCTHVFADLRALKWGQAPLL